MNVCNALDNSCARENVKRIVAAVDFLKKDELRWFY